MRSYFPLELRTDLMSYPQPPWLYRLNFFPFSRPVNRMLFGALTGAACKPREISQTGFLLVTLGGNPRGFGTSAGPRVEQAQDHLKWLEIHLLP